MSAIRIAISRGLMLTLSFPLSLSLSLGLSLSLSLASCSKAEPPPPAPPAVEDALPTVTFQRPAPRQGARQECDSKLELDITVTHNARLYDVVVRATEKHAHEILEVQGDVVTREKIVFLESSSWLSAAGQTATDELAPVHKKTYVIEAKDGATKVTTAEGKPVPPAEARLVHMHYPDFGKPDPFLAALPQRPVTVGESMPQVATAFEKLLLASGAGLKPTARVDSVVLWEAKGGVAVFDIGATMTLDDGSLKMSIPLRGTFDVLEATGMITGLRLEGPVGVDVANNRKANLEIKGRLKLRTTVRAP